MQLTVNQDANNSSWHGNPYFVNTRYKIQALFNKRRGQRISLWRRYLFAARHPHFHMKGHCNWIFLRKFATTNNH